MIAINKCLKGKLFSQQPFFQHNVAIQGPGIRNCTGAVNLLAHDADAFSPGKSDGFDDEIAVITFNEMSGICC
jgi:hypothetical protein